MSHRARVRQLMMAIALMAGIGLTTTWPDLGCQAGTASHEGRSLR